VHPDLEALLALQDRDVAVASCDARLKALDPEVRLLDEQIVAACCPTQTVTQSRDRSRFDEWPHYKSPSWWQADFYRPDRADRAMHDIGGVRR